MPLVAGSSSAGVFCWHALRIERPLLDIRLYANSVFAGASFTTFGLGAALFGAMILVPLYYQEVRHESVIDTGLLNGPQGLGTLIVMPLAGRLTERYGGGRVALVRRLDARAQHDPARVHRREHLDTSRSRSCCSCAASASASAFMPAMTAAFAAMRPEQLSDATPQINVAACASAAPSASAMLAVVLQRGSADAHTTAQLARRVRAHLLVGVRDRAALADPVPGAAQSRAPARRPRPSRRTRRPRAAAPRERDRGGDLAMAATDASPRRPAPRRTPRPS